MRRFGSRRVTAGLCLVACGLALLFLSIELSAAPGWAQCAEMMAHTFVLCDAGPGGWVLPATALVAVAFAIAAGVFFSQARAISGTQATLRDAD